RSVDRARIVGKSRVGFGYLAGYRRIDIGRGLDRFDHHRRIALAERLADLRKLDEDDVAELFLCVFGDSDRGDAAIDLEPLVVFREIAFAHGSLSLVITMRGK